MNILMTLNKRYLKYMHIMLISLCLNNPDIKFMIHVVSHDINQDNLNKIKNTLDANVEFKMYNYQNEKLKNAKTTYRYPLDIYNRLYAIAYLPKDIKRILYLDPDIIVLKELKTLYEMDFEDNYYIGATNIKKVLTKINQLRNKADKQSYYLNTGVLLINLEKLREQQNLDELTRYIIDNTPKLILPDQDVLQGLYGDKVKLVSHLNYNLSDRAITKHNLSIKKDFLIDESWIDNEAYILHFYGKNKPWKENYKGILKPYFQKYDYIYHIKTNS